MADREQPGTFVYFFYGCFLGESLKRRWAESTILNMIFILGFCMHRSAKRVFKNFWKRKSCSMVHGSEQLGIDEHYFIELGLASVLSLIISIGVDFCFCTKKQRKEMFNAFKYPNPKKVKIMWSSVLLHALNSRELRPLTFTKESTQVEEYVKCIQSISNPPVINHDVMKTLTESEQILVVLMHSFQMKEMSSVIQEQHQCSICYEDIRYATSNYMAQLFCCSHAPYFHPHCLSTHIMYQRQRRMYALCPLCNTPLIS